MAARQRLKAARSISPHDEAVAAGVVCPVPFGENNRSPRPRDAIEAHTRASSRLAEAIRDKPRPSVKGRKTLLGQE